MRALVIDEATRRSARELAKFAARPENFYRPGVTPYVPGDLPEFQLHLGTYRIVFTHTASDSKLFRHLSISVPAKGKYPHQVAAFTIATLLGFTGGDTLADDETTVNPGTDWHIRIDETPGAECVILGQEIKE